MPDIERERDERIIELLAEAARLAGEAERDAHEPGRQGVTASLSAMLGRPLRAAHLLREYPDAR